ncbi:MAG: chromosomal replication initiator protein DnaA [candidate division Zixibacteria bacterium]|nr:chromosomal replication initiator protein DnaA [candidate division Zixibacteria bacterium]
MLVQNFIPADNEKIWQECLSYLSQKIKKQSFNTWLKPTKGVPCEEKVLKVAVPNKFVGEWIEEHYLDLIQEAMEKVTQERMPLSFLISAEIGETISRINFENHEKKNATSLKSPKLNQKNNQFNPRYTFDTFVVGESNQFAHAAALAVAEAPGKTKFNPLYVYGGVGLGKTHLAQAIGHYVREEYQELNVLYATSEEFTNDFINSITKNTTQEFVNYYRNVDLLLLDDIQFFAGKESTQVQFFHTFNALYQSGKQIILTSDRPPKDIKGLEERLLSRMQWGLVTDIQPPDLETRIAILQKKNESDGVTIPQDVAVFIADNITCNIRELEGALIRLLAYSSLNGKELSVELAREVLKDVMKNRSKEITIKDIRKKVAESFNLSEESLCSKRKTQEIALARQVAMYLTRSLTKASLKTIGLEFGGRDHSTVIHACNLIADNLKKDMEFKLKIDQIINFLYSS